MIQEKQQHSQTQTKFHTLENGPQPNYKRDSQDKFCLLLYIVLTLVTTAAFTTAFLSFNLNYISRPRGQEFACGQPGWNQSDYPYAYFYNFEGKLDSKKTVCVKKCPETRNGVLQSLNCFNHFNCQYNQTLSGNENQIVNGSVLGYPTITLMNRVCFPQEKILAQIRNTYPQIDSELYQALYEPNVFNFFLDLYNHYVLFAIIIAAIICFSMMGRLLLRLIEHSCVLWTGFIFFTCGSLTFGLILLSYGGKLGTNYLSYLEIDDKNLYMIGIGFLVLAFFHLIFMITQWARKTKNFQFKLKLVNPERNDVQIHPEKSFQENVEESYGENYCLDGTLCTTISFTIILCIVWALCLTSALFLSSSVDFQSNHERQQSIFVHPEPFQEQKNKQIIPFIIIIFIWTLWTQLIIISLAKFLIIYRISLNHFEGRHRIKIAGNQGPLRIGLRYHIGTIIMGSLMSLFMIPFQYLTWVFCEKKDENCLSVLLKWVGKKVLRLNLGGYVFVVLYGNNLNESSQQSHSFFWEESKVQLEQIEQVRVRKLTASLWKWIINIIVICFMLVLINEKGWALNMREPLYILCVAFIIGLGITQLWVQAYELKAETNSVCRCLEPEERARDKKIQVEQMT